MALPLIILLLTGCKKNDQSAADKDKVYALQKEEMNISYGNHP